MPILSFENNNDYVYQARFHPFNPSLFCTVDGVGKLDMWDVNISTENPIISKEITKDALNKVSWSEDGKRVAMGDNRGKIYIYNCEKDVS